MKKIANTWRLVPVDAAQHELHEVRAALGFLPQGYAAMAGLERLADLLAASKPSPTSLAGCIEHDEPITVTVDNDPRGVSVGVWQGSHCIYSGAHPIPTSAGDERDAALYRWLKANIRPGYELPGGYYIDDECTDSWDRTIEAAKQLGDA
ncbi:hypothetical protein MXL91_20235 [Achromobacter ruhlandii]|uniref:hypothetical protein n=1 Tax=Achromobacter ruhlandii TaxID=72557 RepID=UPI002DBC44E7|nr:hypothetical protein [Achromobacter ruhlandii]MEB6663797.1 hypothetical protein [Achromobacter ruhlandii]